MTSFSERMAQGRELAQVRRDRGQHTGKSAAGWNFKRPANENAQWFAKWRTHWVSQCYDIQRAFLRECTNPEQLRQSDEIPF